MKLLRGISELDLDACMDRWQMNKDEACNHEKNNVYEKTENDTLIFEFIIC